jgi:hypothetical protein
MPPGAATARKAEPQSFIGQVVEHLTDNSLTVWVLDDEEGGTYVAYGVDPKAWPVDTIAQCFLVEDGSYVDRLERVSSAKFEQFSSKRIIR